MRQIILDTETTGLDPKSGHRIVEIGCVEVVNFIATGKFFHTYINPERSMPYEAFRVHGLSEDFLSGHPVFKDVCDSFLNFIRDSQLVIHNARFDMGFLNHELMMHDYPPLSFDRSIDTVSIAKRKFPGSPASLDALCRRFAIDNSNRTKHGALLDAELLAEVYLELMGGRQQGLSFEKQLSSDAGAEVVEFVRKERPLRVLPSISSDEQERHRLFIDKLNSPIWSRYYEGSSGSE